MAKKKYIFGVCTRDEFVLRYWIFSPNNEGLEIYLFQEYNKFYGSMWIRIKYLANNVVFCKAECFYCVEI